MDRVICAKEAAKLSDDSFHQYGRELFLVNANGLVRQSAVRGKFDVSFDFYGTGLEASSLVQFARHLGYESHLEWCEPVEKKPGRWLIKISWGSRP